MSEASLEFRLVDAFALSAYSGNVAGVILDAEGLTDRQMQLIAGEFNASETTFVLPATSREAPVRFRWFTPGCEVGFCGHATIGAVHALREAGRFAHELREPGTVLPIESPAGLLTVRIESGGGPRPDTIWLDIPRPQPKNRSVALPNIVRHLGLSMEAVDPAIPAIRTNDDDVIFAVRDLPTLLGINPSMGELARYCRGEQIRGVFVTTTNVLSKATAVQSRFFAPAAGVDEDPVTGSAHGPLGLHLVKTGVVPMVDGKADFCCAQAKAGGRAGLVRVVVTRSAAGEEHVRIGGSCVTVGAGVLKQLPEP